MSCALFPPEYFVALKRLRGRLSAAPLGLRAVARRGTTVPGFERRAWQLGDRRRQVDWRATARAGRTMVRSPELERGGLLCLVLDRSASMAPANPDRDLAQRRLALALSWLALEQGARVLMFAHQGPPARFSGWSRRAAVVSFLRDLSPPTGRDRFSELRLRPLAGSVLHVLSDPWLTSEVQRSWSSLAPGFHERQWTTLLLPEEASPPRACLELESVEEGTRLVVDLEADYAAFRIGWESFRRTQRAGLVDAGFRPVELSCESAVTDAAAVLRRAAQLGVL